MNPEVCVAYCWFHDFDHPFDGVSDGWGCNAWGPEVIDGRLHVGPLWNRPEIPREK